jgi:hypothetical protein
MSADCRDNGGRGVRAVEGAVQDGDHEVKAGWRELGMARGADDKQAGNGTSANLGFEAELWAAAATMRNNMDAAEYKHVVRMSERAGRALSQMGRGLLSNASDSIT